jgi:hypothetical protein
MFGFSALGQ